MKKSSAKICIGVLSAVMIYTSVAPSISHASTNTSSPEQTVESSDDINVEDYAINVLVDNEEEKTVETVEDGKVIHSTLDKEMNVITITTEGEESIVIDLNAAYEEAESEPEFSVMAVIAQENTWTNYEYTINTGNKWQLRRPNPDNPLTKTLYKNVTEKSSNRSNLNSFKKSVDNLNSAEWRYIGTGLSVPIGVAATIVLGSLTGGTGAVAGAWATAGITGKAASHALDMHRHAKDAKYYYFKV